MSAAGRQPALGRVGVWLSAIGGVGADRQRDAARRIEELGYPTLWVGESPTGKEAFVNASLLLAATERLIVALGIASIYARDASAMQNGRLALGEAYPGRFVLGIGVSHAPLVASRGHEYDPRPVRAMREYLDAMDRAMYSPPMPERPVPVLLGALRPRMLELAAARTAGTHPYFTPVAHTARAREIVGPGPLVAPELMVILDEDPVRARAAARAAITLYLGLPNYTNNLREFGYGDDDFSGGGSDRLVDAIVAWGSPEAIGTRVREHLDAGADHVCVQPLRREGGLPALLDDLEALAPTLLAL